MSNSSPSPSPDAGHEAAPLAWLLALLQEAIVGVMAEATPASKKANTLARLGSLYLKTYHTAELARVNAELEERVAELEERQAAIGVDTTAGEEETAGQARREPEGSPAAGRTGTATPPGHRSRGKHRPARGRRARPRAR